MIDRHSSLAGLIAGLRHPPLPCCDPRAGRGTAIIPTHKSGRFWKEDCSAARIRNDIQRSTRLVGRTIWSGGPAIMPEVALRRKCAISDHSKRGSYQETPDRQTAENHIRIAIMNRFNPLGQAEIERVAQGFGEGGNTSPQQRRQ